MNERKWCLANYLCYVKIFVYTLKIESFMIEKNRKFKPNFFCENVKFLQTKFQKRLILYWLCSMYICIELNLDRAMQNISIQKLSLNYFNLEEYFYDNWRVHLFIVQFTIQLKLEFWAFFYFSLNSENGSACVWHDFHINKQTDFLLIHFT